MNAAVVPASASVTFQDPLGERRPIADPTGTDTLELLCLRSELTSVPSFEFALRERVGRLANFRHAYYGRVRSVDRLNDGSTLALVSDRVPGVRLSEVLRVAEGRQLTLDINAALSLIRQLVPAIALLHEHARDVAHGALGPERLVITPNARLVIVEHVLGAALEQLRFSHDRYWNELQIPVSRSAGLPRFDHRTDVMQLGIVALSLVLGRLLREDEYPAQLPEVVASAWAISARGGLEPLPSGLRSWLTRALQLDPRNSFPSAVEARAELDRMFGDSDYIVAPNALETFLAQYQDIRALSEPPPTSKKPEEPKVEARRERPIAPTPVVEPVKPVSVGISDPVKPASVGFDVAKPLSTGIDPVKLARPIAAEPAKPQSVAVEPVKPLSVAADPVKPIPVASLPIDDENEIDWPSESEEGEEMGRRMTTTPLNWSRWAAVGVALVAVLVGGVFAGRRYFVATATVPATGTLTVTTDPPGAQVTVDGVLQGVSPINLTLQAGAHAVELRAGAESRSIPVTITAGAQASQYIELAKVTVATGQLQVRTEPAGAQVTVDGLPRGRSPLTVGDLQPGAHSVVLENEAGSVKQDVTVDAGATASLVVPMTVPQNAPVSGWITLLAPVTMQLYENGRLLGTSESERIMVSAGRHEIEVTNQPLAYRAIYTVQVTPGKVAPLKIDLPKQKMALNAVPWAEVWVDGEKVGETPIGDVSVSVGPHEILFRHPQLGEQRHAITVTAAAPARLSVDMRKQ
jgi:serine/threonine protein kinase